MAVALALGLAPRAAAEFSFLLGTVAIAGAAVLMLPDLAAASPEQLGNLALGSVAALLSGLGRSMGFRPDAGQAGVLSFCLVRVGGGSGFRALFMDRIEKPLDTKKEPRRTKVLRGSSGSYPTPTKTSAWSSRVRGSGAGAARAAFLATS